MNTPLWSDEYISIAIEDSGIADEDWLPVELMLKAMRDEYESRRVPAVGVPVDALGRVTAWVADWCNGNDDGFDDLAADVIECRAWLRSLQPQPGREGE